ncbi:hypothetical protein BDP55DRAFT_426207 [Colletotrichum godetiae]|uniref:Uncharacterized protein n=1 Tax=Colletotrichum godetiae TaxID=1209918 RepID=A0AAJ0ARF0_9PEZI|nr:uncharacterized protein BDP55DRAFT_426207 [Colletotrichum godetiae]KAK1688998.1 hypothetical protein BDP55DRAFT_426207 [Colletotrichum godetiae]
MKRPQMLQLGNLGKKMSHYFETRTTLALIHGWDIFSDVNKISGDKIISHMTAIHEMIKTSSSLLCHPLLLPTTFLRLHLTKAEIMSGQLNETNQKDSRRHSGRSAGEKNRQKTSASPQI